MSGPLQSSVVHTRDVGRLHLPNGLRVLTREVHHSPTVAAMIWYRVGSRHEQSGATGRSHFLEHMLFKGTERYRKGEIDLLTMKHGGTNNAFTSYDFTAYYFCFASDRWETALDIEADRMLSTVFDPVEFEAERQVVIEELKSSLDQPWGALMQKLNRQAYLRHPYGNPVIGWLEDLESASLSAMQDYYRSYYCPANATLVLVGDFDTADAVARVQDRFGMLRPGAPPTPAPAVEPPQVSERRFELHWPSEIPRIAIAYHAPAIGAADSYALQLLASLLSEGKSSRLYQRLVECDRSATFVSAEYAEAHDPTLFYIRVEGRAHVDPRSIEAAIDDEIGKVSRDGVTDHELDRARHQIEAHFIFSMERSLDQAMLLGQIETLASLDYIDGYLPSLARVGPVDVSDVCKRYLHPCNRTVGWMLPTMPPSDDREQRR